MTVNNQNNGPKVFTSNQAKSASIGEMKSMQVSGAVLRTRIDTSAAAEVRQGLATGVAYVSQGAATVFGAMGMTQVANMAATAGAKMSQIGQMGDKPVTMTMNIKSLSTGGTPTMQANAGQNGMGQNSMGGIALGQNGQQSGQPGQQQSGGSPFGAGTSGGGMKMTSNNTNGAAFGAGAGALPGMDGSTGSVGGANNSSNPIGAAAGGGGGQDQLLNATKAMQETQMSFNLQYLQLQSQMQHENRSYTAISNIMKTKHDTVKNSISNVR